MLLLNLADLHVCKRVGFFSDFVFILRDFLNRNFNNHSTQLSVAKKILFCFSAISSLSESIDKLMKDNHSLVIKTICQYLHGALPFLGLSLLV